MWDEPPIGSATLPANQPPADNDEKRTQTPTEEDNEEGEHPLFFSGECQKGSDGPGRKKQPQGKHHESEEDLEWTPRIAREPSQEEAVHPMASPIASWSP